MPRKTTPRNTQSLRDLGAVLQRARDYAGLTQEKAAAALGLNRDRLANIERGQRVVLPHELRDMGNLYAIDLLSPQSLPPTGSGEAGVDNSARPLADILADLHPNDLAVIRQFAVILAAERAYLQRIGADNAEREN
jgi:transcriptional regulator with XRE-family HTH domain